MPRRNVISIEARIDMFIEYNNKLIANSNSEFEKMIFRNMIEAIKQSPYYREK